MILDVLLWILKVLGAVWFMVICKGAYKNRQVDKDLERLRKQGMFYYPGNETFIVGAIPKLAPKYEKEMKERVLPPMLIYLLQ